MKKRPLIIIPTNVIARIFEVDNKITKLFPFDHIYNQIKNGSAKSHYVFGCELNFSSITENDINTYDPERIIKLGSRDYVKIADFFERKIIPDIRYKMISINSNNIASEVLSLIKQYYPDNSREFDLYANRFVLFSEYNVVAIHDINEIIGNDVYININFSNIRKEVSELHTHYCDEGVNLQTIILMGMLIELL